MNKSDFVMPIFFGVSGVVVILLVLFFPSENDKINEAILATGGYTLTGAIALTAPNFNKKE